MKSLSLWQPWASLVALGIKTIETRSWETRYRGEIAIHAAKQWTAEQKQITRDLHLYRHLRDAGWKRGEIPFWCSNSQDWEPPLGCVVGLVEILDCRWIGPEPNWTGLLSARELAPRRLPAGPLRLDDGKRPSARSACRLRGSAGDLRASSRDRVPGQEDGVMMLSQCQDQDLLAERDRLRAVVRQARELALAVVIEGGVAHDQAAELLDACVAALTEAAPASAPDGGIRDGT